ncbi:hypothetical protein [Hymenobacter sp. B1770]|uniref:hypothetical protein n=1 Tax=Hymenobacter sp. B1770 TaxID=1718788 RepID=UPI003CECC78E
MLNIIWSVLNVALALGFVYFAFRAVQLVKQHIGLGAALFLSVTLLIIGCSKSGKPTSSGLPSPNLLSGVPKDASLGNASAIQHINLGGTNTLFLRAEYWLDNGIIRPRGLYAGVSGWMSGHDWEPVYGRLEPQGSQVRYTAMLHHHWSLLGLRVFTLSSKVFEGVMPPRK